MASGSEGGYAGAQVGLFESTLFPRAPFLRRRNTVHVLATACAAAQAGCEKLTHLKHRDRPARRGDELDNDHYCDNDNDKNGKADYDARRMMQDWLSEPSVTVITNRNHDETLRYRQSIDIFGLHVFMHHIR